MALPEPFPHFVRQVRLPRRILLASALSACLSACNLVPAPLGESELQGLQSELEQLETLVAATRADLQSMSAQQQEQMDGVTNRLSTIDGDVKRVPGLIETACQSPAEATITCEEVSQQSVVTSDDKMVVGEIEHLRLEPPGIELTARIDTGSANNSIHALQVTPFERDGADWVRFNMHVLSADDAETKNNKPISVEREVVRVMRTSKRPVVRLRVRLGNVLDSFEFILADRSTSDHTVELGRNFLQDVALVDVGRQFVQPRSDNSN